MGCSCPGPSGETAGQCCLLRATSLYVLKCLQQSFGHNPGPWTQVHLTRNGLRESEKVGFSEGQSSLSAKYTLVYEACVLLHGPQLLKKKNEVFETRKRSLHTRVWISLGDSFSHGPSCRPSWQQRLWGSLSDVWAPKDP